MTIIERTYLILAVVFFVLAFAVRNIKTYLATGVSIKGKSPIVTASIALSTVIYILIICRITFLCPCAIFEIAVPTLYLAYAGYMVVALGFILGVLALIAMKNSWRVGIRYEQKTELVTNGIYAYSRNPYFFSYRVLILGYILVFPSVILIGLFVALMIAFHKMILEEEKYLESVHGQTYVDYKSKVCRYFGFKTVKQ